MVLEVSLQRLGIGSEARKTDVELVVDLVDPLEIGGDGLQLHSQTPIAGNREAVFPHHGDESASIVLEDLQNK